ncbi:LysR family transcriptional regulator [Photobacterium gaetbulicola]|uniref:LysR family transcriptional regulator n=1 Tax=Photobacterium gaetbulicola TaxID=1295392 RepID=A0A0B9G3N3_9GAMM|nr:LysR family transcriptional regulator [Photobacterium gaetbulicola]KHT63194.1 LysR family transcriptional regulator [Photobacterium gaetbulicola]
MPSRLHAHIGTFRQLEILLAVHEQGSIKSASETLFLTQPTVSMQLKKLTEAIGLPLYQQVGRKLKFTDAGLATIATAKKILQNCEELDMQLSSLRGLKSGTLRLACVTTAKYFIPHLLGPFCEHYPGIDIQFTIANRQQIIERLEQGMDDFYVFSHLPEGLDLDVIEFMSNDLVAIAEANHPLANRNSVSLEEFCQQDFLIREQGSGTRYAIEDFFKQQQHTPNIKMTIASNEAIIHSVLSRLGVAILSAHTLAFGEIYGVKKVNVEGLPIQSKWSFSWTKAESLSPIAQVFLSYVETEGREMMRKAVQF